MMICKAMKYNNIRNFLVGVAFFLTGLTFSVFGQKTAVNRDPEAHYKTGLELFEKEKYSAAYLEFDKMDAILTGVSTSTRENASYYKAVCATELFHTDAEAQLTAFINQHPESIQLRLAYFQLGRLYYKQKRFKNATDAFEKADIYYLTNDEITEFYFKSGYGYFIKADMAKAEKSLHNVINVESKYKTAANYYYAHIAYANNNYNTALASFNKLNESEAFGPVVPLYIAQIYFEQEKYDELISYAVPLLENSKLQNTAEIKRLIAESWFRKSEYTKALEYFIEYQKNVSKISREDNYQIAFCYFQVKKYEEAIKGFQKVSDGNDQLAQNACYHLGDCYLKTNNKQSARSSFQLASKWDFDKKIAEDALFYYARLSYELSFQPVAINTFRDFQKRFPESSRKDEINLLLADIYMTTHNYKDALLALESIEKKTELSKRAYQKVAYFRGIEFYNDGDRSKAISLFDKSIVNSVNPGIASQAMYWKAEALYANQQYEASMKEYRIFLFASGSTSLPNFNTVHYNIGYCYFKMENYDEAQIWFRKYLKNKAETDEARYNDATIRIADANFMRKEYEIALDFYRDAVSFKSKAADYCLFQQGMIYGIKGQMNEKAQAMQSVISSYKKSGYLDDAIFEKGNALLASGRNEEALGYFQRIVVEFPNSSYNRKALINTGLINYTENNDEKALATYKQVISKYPSTPEASEALTGIKNIYVNSGNPNGYFEYIKSVPSTSISAGAQDSITYEAAEQRYMKGESGASNDFSNYMKQFPTGYFILNATFYKAEMDYKNKDFPEALRGYEFIITHDRNIFTEKSLLKAALINYKNTNYENAQVQFKSLRDLAEFPENILAAQTGLMRCSFRLKNYEQAIAGAQQLVESEKVSVELQNEAHLVAGKSSLELKAYREAQNELGLAARVSNSETGADAKYNLAYLQYLLGNFKESQKLAFEVINQVPSYDFWIAKSFLLLADCYLALKDNFQAKSTLKSLIDNYEKNANDSEDIRALANEKLASITAVENEQLKKDLNEGRKPILQESDSIDGEQ